MNKLPLEQRAQILALLVEGNSLRATTRLGDVRINTVTKLLVDVGTTCQAYHDEHGRGLTSKRIQCDESWSFCYAKARNVPTTKSAPEGTGDVWTWTAINAETKLVVSYLVGGRDAEYASEFMNNVAGRLTNRVQLTDGHRPYLVALEDAFGSGVDFAQLVKHYGQAPEGQRRL